MKKMRFFYIYLIAVFLIISSCTENESTPMNCPTTVERVLNARIEQSGSRSVVYADGSYQWLENDHIGVYGSETSNAEFTYINQENTNNQFKGGLNTATEEVLFAYFPYSMETIYENEQLSFIIPGERAVDNSNSAPMLGWPSENNEICFSHLGAVLHIRFVGLPDKATRMVVTSSGTDAPYLSGTAVVSNIHESNTYRIIDGLNTVTFDLSTIEDQADFNGIHIPLQEGNYEKIVLTILDNNHQVLIEKQLSNIEAFRAHIIETPMLNFNDELYAYVLPDEWIAENLNFDGYEWDAAYYLSNDNFIYLKEFQTGLLFHHMNFFYRKENGVPWFHYIAQLDSLGRPVSISVNDIMYTYMNYTESTYDKCVFYADGTVEEFTGLEYKNNTRSISRVSADGSHENLLHVNRFIQDAGDIYDLYGNLNDIRDTGEFIRDYPKAPNVNEIMGTNGRNQTVNIGGMRAGLATDAAVGITQLSSSAVTATVDVFIKGQEKLFGNARIAAKKPELTNGILAIGYDVYNVNELAYGEDKYNMGLLIRRLPIGTPNPREIYYYSSDVERIFSVSSEKISYESGYTYYIRPFIKPLVISKDDGGWHRNDNTIMYGGCVSFTPSNTLEVNEHFPEMTYKNGEFHFSVDVKGFTEDINGTHYMIFRYNNFNNRKDKKDDILRSWNIDDNHISVNYSVLPQYINFSEKKYPFVYVYGSPINSIIDEENREGIWPEYKQEASLFVTMVDIQAVSRSSSRTLYDDNKDKTYEDDITVYLRSEGTGLIEKVWCIYSKGGTWAADASPTDDGQEFKCTGSTNKYSENNGPGTITVRAKLRDGTEYTGPTIILDGIPISGYHISN